MPDAGCGLRREKVALGSLEEFQHRLVFKRRRIGEVDHCLRAGQNLSEPFAGYGVDPAVGRGGDDLVAALAQDGDRLRADQAGAADDDDLHELTSVVDDGKPEWFGCAYSKSRSRLVIRLIANFVAHPRGGAEIRRSV